MRCLACGTEYPFMSSCPTCEQVGAAKRAAAAAEALVERQRTMEMTTDREREWREVSVAVEESVKRNFAKMVVVIQRASPESVSALMSDLCSKLLNTNSREFAFDRAEIYRTLFADYIIRVSDKAYAASLAQAVVEEFVEQRVGKLSEERETIGEGGAREEDPLYEQAVEIVVRTRRPSISLVQNHLRIGYNRAASLIDAMERAGLVSSVQANGDREVLIPTLLDEYRPRPSISASSKDSGAEKSSIQSPRAGSIERSDLLVVIGEASIWKVTAGVIVAICLILAAYIGLYG